MTSLIFGSIYLGHHAIVSHRREKQRKKNYQRWEGLREDYDEQKRTQRESRSLDIQRTGIDPYETDPDKPILTLRDQQEANDARTGWRPQESWGQSQPDLRRQSLQMQRTGRGNFSGEFKPQKTGAAWDEGLPEPLRVNRMSFEENDSFPNSPRMGTPVRMASKRSQMTNASSVRSGSPASSIKDPEPQTLSPRVEEIVPLNSHVPGGRMAELIEFGNSTQPASARSSPPQPQPQPQQYPPQQQFPSQQQFPPPQQQFPPQQQLPLLQQQLPLQQTNSNPFQSYNNPYIHSDFKPYQLPQVTTSTVGDWWEKP